MSSPSEERAQRQATKADDKLAIALYRECYALQDAHSLGVCTALRTKYPRLAKVFEQVECHTNHAAHLETKEEE